MMNGSRIIEEARRAGETCLETGVEVMMVRIEGVQMIKHEFAEIVPPPDL